MLLSTGSGAGLWTVYLVFEGEWMGLSDELDGDDLTNELMDEGEKGLGRFFSLSDFPLSCLGEGAARHISDEL